MAQKASGASGRKGPASRQTGEIGFGETKGPRWPNPVTRVVAGIEEVGRIISVVLVIDRHDKGGDRGQVLNQLGATLDDDGLVGIIGRGRGPGGYGGVG